MAYVPVPFPMVRYDSTGLSVTVQNADALAALPATFTPAPTTVAALVAFPPAIIATVVVMPLPALPATLTTLIALNTPKSKSRGRDN